MIPKKIASATAFVTGAAGGIGRCLVDALLARGVKRIYVADLHASGVDPFKGEARLVPIDLDITDEASVASAAARAADTTLLINNAGVNLRAPFLAAPSMAAARREMDTNYFGTLAMCRAFAPLLMRNSSGDGSAIVNVLSILAKVTLPNLGSYCAAKAALLRLTEGIRAELGGEGVKVLAVMPWAVDTPMSGPFPGVKTPPAEIAAGTLDALERGDEEAYFHAVTDEINAALKTDPKALERSLAATFRRAR